VSSPKLTVVQQRPLLSVPVLVGIGVALRQLIQSGKAHWSDRDAGKEHTPERMSSKREERTVPHDGSHLHLQLLLQSGG
jgi:hypothetical protein